MTQSNVKIAVTGGIGSGKSTVLNFLRELGFKVISLDNVYKQLLKESDFKKLIAAEFGNVFSSDGSLDRNKLAEMVFSDSEKLIKLNNLTHPLIYKRAFEQAQNFKLCFFEVPLLFEEGGESKFDEVIVIVRDTENRIKSVELRDNLSEDEVKIRINRQFDYNIDKLSKYYVIHNNGNLNDLSMEIEAVVHNLRCKYGI